MSKVVRFALEDSKYDELIVAAEKAGKSVQDYVRGVLFPDEPIYSFDAAQAVSVALKKYNKGETFTLPDLYSQSEWEMLTCQTGTAGAHGKRFNKYIEEHCIGQIEMLEEIDKATRRAVYKIL